MKNLLFLILLLPLWVGASPDRTMTTDDGQKIVVHEDGTWEPVRTIVASRAKGPEGFYGFTWKTERKDIIAKMGTPDENFDDVLIYKQGQLYGKSAEIIFGFDDGLFLWGAYGIPKDKEGLDRSNSVKNEKIVKTYFMSWKNELTKNFGESKFEEVWHDERFKGIEAKSWTALSTGDMMVRLTWKWPKSKITMVMDGQDGKGHLMVYVFSTIKPPPKPDLPPENVEVVKRQGQGPKGFEGISWGTSKSAVKAKGGILSNEGEDFLVYFIIRNGQSVFAKYHFSGGKLFAGNYHLAEPTKNPKLYEDFTQYLIDFETWVLAIKDEFGPENSELTQVDWKNERFKGDPDKFRYAMIFGEVVVTMYWDWPDSQMSLVFQGEPNGKVQLITTYVKK